MSAPAKMQRVLLVGCGAVAGGSVQAFQNSGQAEFAGFVDLRPEAAGRFRDEFAPGAEIGTDAAALIDALAPDIVVNCTVPDAHHAVTVKALRTGAHVLTEKPLAASLAEAHDIAREAAAAQRVVAVIQNRRYTRGVRAVRRVIAEGRLGAIQEITCDYFMGPHFGGFRDEMEHVVLLDMSIHHFDMARFLLGEDAAAVYCREWNPPGSWYRHAASAHAIFEMTGGTTFGYRASWCAEGERTAWGGRWRVVGTEGSLSWNGDEAGGEGAIWHERRVGTEEFLRATERRPEIAVPCPEDDGRNSLVREFLACLGSGTLPPTHAADNVRSLEMVFGAIASANARQRVTLPLA